ncbi:MAG: RidA family protein [Isosphaeraceae bacterium]
MPLIDHPSGDYRFLPGIAPYSCGVVSKPGFEVAHVTLHRPVPYAQGFEVIAAQLAAEGRPKAALCAIELRSPLPFSFRGFGEFNAEYARILEGWGLFVEGVNPVARTNVAPAVDPAPEPVLYGFSYSRPCDPSMLPTFVVAGAGELPEGVLEAEGIFRAGDTSPGGIAAKAQFVMDLMENRLRGLEADWPGVTAIDVYTIHPIATSLPEIILRRAGAAATHGVRWFYSRPPIVGIEYEMDLRGVRTELRLY